jgi:hypothetical protein
LTIAAAGGGDTRNFSVVVQADAMIRDGSNLKGQPTKAFESFKFALAEHRQVPPEGSHGFPSGISDRISFYSGAKAKQGKEADVTDDTLRRGSGVGDLVKKPTNRRLGPIVLSCTAGQPWTCPDIELFVRPLPLGRTGQLFTLVRFSGGLN